MILTIIIIKKNTFAGLYAGLTLIFLKWSIRNQCAATLKYSPLLIQLFFYCVYLKIKKAFGITRVI